MHTQHQLKLKLYILKYRYKSRTLQLLGHIVFEMAITKVFGDNSTTWNENFGAQVLKVHLTLRSFLLFASVAFFGAMLIIESGDKIAYKKSICESDTKIAEEIHKTR